jgi:hypothetical protein
MTAAAEVAPRTGKGRGKERRRWVLGFWFIWRRGGGLGWWRLEEPACQRLLAQFFFF